MPASAAGGANSGSSTSAPPKPRLSISAWTRSRLALIERETVRVSRSALAAGAVGLARVDDAQVALPVDAVAQVEDPVAVGRVVGRAHALRVVDPLVAVAEGGVGRAALLLDAPRAAG